jgi:excisionase family DNA binding protein
MSSIDPSNLVSISDAAREKDCSRTTLYRAIDDGRLNAVEVGDRQMLIRDEDFKAFEPRWKGQRVRKHRDDDSDSS